MCYVLRNITLFVKTFDDISLTIRIKCPVMIDPFGRHVTYLRVSVTDRCDFRCVYCMSENMTFLPKSEVLSLEELDRLCSVFIRKGVRRLRLTGGEPLVRRDIMTLISSLGRHIASGKLDELTLTTNGSQLAKFADDLKSAGVERINVSVDSLDPDNFRRITRRGDFGAVIEGIDAAKRAGLSIKINMVALKGVNDDEIDQMVRWCGNEGFDLTFIETMPMGAIDSLRSDTHMPLSAVRQRIEETLNLDDVDFRTGGPARYAVVAETGQRIGFIAPLSHNFCESCNRVRLTCTGRLFMCLGQDDEADLRGILRASESDQVLSEAIDAAIERKPKGHDFIIDRDNDSPAVERHMSVTGG